MDDANVARLLFAFVARKLVRIAALRFLSRIS